MPEEPNKQLVEAEMSFEERQNALGFLSTLLETVLENPELFKKIFNEKNG